MATGFTRTMRALERESFRGSAVAVVAAAALLASWIVWCTTARIALYETTSAARLETDRAASPIQAPMQDESPKAG